jgi:tight adherence protein B
MPLLIPALGGALVVAGIIGVLLGARRTPVAPPAPRRRNQSRLSSRWSGMERRTKILAIAGLVAGALIYLFTGWLIAVVLGPPGRGRSAHAAVRPSVSGPDRPPRGA